MEHTILTPCGPIRGVAISPEVTAFKGIRYATAGRWEYPTVVTAWEGEYQADHYGHCSYQPRTFRNEEMSSATGFYYREFRKGLEFTYDEDCLFLNIFAPAKAKSGDKLPVVLYIHGGGFLSGCGHEKHFDGPRWAEYGVIAVTINYRLGPMGFVCLPQLHEEAGHSGNYGLFDQLAAMQWVHDNIAAFGGDPENVTLMGQSSGAMSITNLFTSPYGEGLFHKAIMSSGGGVRKMFNIVSTEQERYGFWLRVMSAAGCDSLARFRALDPKRLFAVYEAERKNQGGSMDMVAGVCLDGDIVAERPVLAVAEGKTKNLPCMIGSTSKDLMPPVSFDMSMDWCKAQHSNGKAPCYCWFFDREVPGDKHGAWHSSDLWYWFGTLKNGWRPWEKKDYEISRQMVGYLTNFAKSGDPNGPGLPQWKPVDNTNARAMFLGDGNNHMGSPNKLKLWWTMLTNKTFAE